jgi:hypothetical protein
MPPDREPAKGPWRLAWFVGLYAVSIVLFAALVYGMRALIPR